MEDGLAGQNSCSYIYMRLQFQHGQTHLHPWATSLKAPLTTEARNCPPVMTTILSTTSFPRILAGEDSAMYKGTHIENKPVGRGRGGWWGGGGEGGGVIVCIRGC